MRREGRRLPDSAIDAIAAACAAAPRTRTAPSRSSEEIDALIAEAHRAGADFLGCDPDEVVFGQNATSLLLHLSRSFSRTLRPGDEVVVTRLDHDANVRPWIFAARDAGAVVRWADVRDDDVTLDLASFDGQLSDRTRLVAFTLASNAVGTIPPAAELVRRAKAAGALVALDGVHFAQHRAIDLRAIGADIVATSPYKFFGPHQGMIGVRRELLASLEPYRLRPASDAVPDRWESGTQSHESMAGTIAAIGYIAGRRWRCGWCDGDVAGFAAFDAHERALATRFLEGVGHIPGVRLIGIADLARIEERTPDVRDQGRAGSIRRRPPRRSLGEASSRGTGITTRSRSSTGSGCSSSGGAVRIGFCHYHTLEEVDRVLARAGGAGSLRRPRSRVP